MEQAKQIHSEETGPHFYWVIKMNLTSEEQDFLCEEHSIPFAARLLGMQSLSLIIPKKTQTNTT